MTVINEKPFIKSLYDKINSENKTWIRTIFMCDENEIEQTNIEDNTSIIVKSIEGYQFKIEIDAEKNKATLTQLENEVEEIESVTITFDINTNKGQQGSMEPQSIKKEKNTKLSKNTFTKNRYLFKEWNTSPDGTGASYKDEAIIKVKEDTTLYAIWKPNVTKTYLYNVGQTNSEIQSIEKYVSGSSKAGTFTVNPTYLSVRKSASNSEWNHLYLISKGMFDFTGFSKLYVSFSYMKLVTAQKYTDNNIRQGLVRFGISTSNTNFSDSSFDAFTDAVSPREHSAVSEGARVLEVDISDFDNLAFLKFWCNTGNWTGQQTDFDIDQIWVE